jgi:hypothetical protein
MTNTITVHSRLMLGTSRPALSWGKQWGQVSACHCPSALNQDNLNLPLSNSDQKPLFLALCFAEYHSYEHSFIVRELLDLSQPWEHLWGPFRGMLSGRVDRLSHMAPVKSHAEPWEIASDKGASSLLLPGFYVWNETLSTDTWGNIMFLSIRKFMPHGIVARWRRRSECRSTWLSVPRSRKIPLPLSPNLVIASESSGKQITWKKQGWFTWQRKSEITSRGFKPFVWKTLD